MQASFYPASYGKMELFNPPNSSLTKICHPVNVQDHTFQPIADPELSNLDTPHPTASATAAKCSPAATATNPCQIAFWKRRRCQT